MNFKPFPPAYNGNSPELFTLQMSEGGERVPFVEMVSWRGTGCSLKKMISTSLAFFFFLPAVSVFCRTGPSRAVRDALLLRQSLEG